MYDMRGNLDLGTWGAFKTGWWAVHIVGIIVVGYIGFWIGKTQQLDSQYTIESLTIESKVTQNKSVVDKQRFYFMCQN